jgi:hypothetical protein
MRTYTSNEILFKEDLYELQFTFSSCAIPFKYKITEDELNWAKFNKGKYSINDWVLNNIDKEGFLVFNCPFELSECLQNDGIDHKAVMLSDETALQKLFFWLSLNAIL